MPITYAVERATDIIEEIKPLLQEHYEEIARHQDKIKLNPNYDTYRSMDEAGLLHVITVRDDGVLVGYFICVVMPNLHYQDCLCAVNDILFVGKPYRKGLLAFKMLKYAEKTLRERGVDKVLINMKLAHDFGPLLERLGYVEIERVFEKMFI